MPTPAWAVSVRLQWLRRLELKEETSVEVGRLWLWLLMTSISIVISMVAQPIHFGGGR